MDPITIMAVATAAFNGVKAAVNVGKEIEEVYGQLSKWAASISDLHECIHQEDNKKPGIFEKIDFTKNATSEAFDTYTAKVKIHEMEKEIYTMFLYGDLSHLGADGYREFAEMRKKIKEDREKMIYEQMRRKKDFFEAVKDWTVLTLATLIFTGVIWYLVNLVSSHAK